MAQTDPPILDINNEILLPLKLPDQHDFKDLCFIAPKPEVMFTVRPKTPEDPRNWAESPLYKFMSVEWLKEMIDKKEIKLLDGEKRP